MTVEENLALARRGVELFNARDSDGLREITTSDFVWRPAMGRLEEREYRGPTAWDDYDRDIGASFEGLGFEIDSLRPIGSDTVLVTGRLHGSGAASGTPVSGERGVVVRFRDGRVALMHSFPSVDEAERVAEEGAA